MNYKTCELCHQPMAPGTGCTVSTVTCNGKEYERILVGDMHDFDPCLEKGDVCHDCNAGVGQYHHDGCDAESCPHCHGQLYGCDCEVE